MTYRLIISFILLVVASFEVTAKSIVLEELNFSKMPTLEKIINIVGAEGDSIVKGEKIYVMSLREYRGGLYLNIELLKGVKLPNVSNYIGFYKMNNNLFFIRSHSDIGPIIRTGSNKRFTLDLSPPKVDGGIRWIYFTIKNEVYPLKFNSNW